MSKIRRLRVFAGPNGSGKSTLFQAFSEKFNAGYFINSDLLEKELSEHGFINLELYNITTNQEEWEYFCESTHAKTLIKKSKEIGHQIEIYIKENVIVDKSKDTHSYEASLITSFIRHLLFRDKQSFSFETVMSHPSKLDEIIYAKEKGYKTYLYFICLDDPELNISRVQDRVQKGGHAVGDDKIVERYSKTLENLLPAIKLVDKAYIFDNSSTMTLIAESVHSNITINVDEEDLPNWFIDYILNKV
jgi:predicted ABC-type ATPase